MNENVRISIQLSLKFVHKCPIDNKSALVLVFGCGLFGAKPLPEPLLSQITGAYMRHLGGWGGGGWGVGVGVGGGGGGWGWGGGGWGGGEIIGGKSSKIGKLVLLC